jgi:hypothetical protein
MPSSSARLCSGAKAETLAIADFTFGVIRTGSSNAGPPCTTLCPTTSISVDEETARASQDLEGFVAKRKQGQYLLENGTAGWVKIKNRQYTQIIGRNKLFHEVIGSDGR